MKTVLLLGDSIRMGYQPLVKEMLAGHAEVVGPGENCRFAKYTLWSVDEWVGEHGIPDVIHWNNGIWDVYHRSEEDGIFTPLEEYIATIRRILTRLRKTGAPIIWATTTPVHPGKTNLFNHEIDIYNAAIVKLMQAEQVAVTDLNAVIKANIEAYISEDLLHLTDQGSHACAEAVVRAVSPFIP